MRAITLQNTDDSVDNAPAACFHCGEPVPVDAHYPVIINDESRPMCCAGCRAVAETICSLGLTDYYRHRTVMPERPQQVPEFLPSSRLYDKDEIQQSFVSTMDGNRREAELIVEGLVCPACAWLIESRINPLPGVAEVTVNFSDQRCRIRWDQARIKLSDILYRIRELGYDAQPYSKARQQANLASGCGRGLRHANHDDRHCPLPG